MTTQDPARCSAYDQISDRGCRFDAGHGGRHNFARLDHDALLERVLRRELDVMTKALVEALDIFDTVWCPEHGHAPSPEYFARVRELRKLVQP